MNPYECGSCAGRTGTPPPNAYNASRRGYAHGIPRQPFTIDGEPGDPVRLAALRNQPLHTVVGLEAGERGSSAVAIYTDEDAATETLRRASNPEGEPSAPNARARLGLTLDLTMWEHIELSGCAWEFDTNTDISVLTNFDLAWSCGFLFWGWRQLGTNASSFMVAIAWPYFGFRDRAGNSIAWILNPPSGASTLWSGVVRDLVPLGWNDRAISITLPGATYP
ncbi:hypothetical protein AB0J83_45465 [Actinoplanes sp. NPDC049596]|uniref:hypothetical protein n=1 Tax=unclassified Actinoplanes TaxID=2626549 RepID=UPI00341E4DD2